MTWLGDLVSGAGEFYSDNKDWIKPLVGAGVGAYQQSQKDRARSQYVDYLREKENQNYQSALNDINAYNAQLAASGSGGGGGGGSGAAAAAAEANKLAAESRANRSLQRNYKDILKMYQPFTEAANRLLPQKTQSYENSLALQNSLAQLVSSPENVAKFNASIPSYQVGVPVPNEIKLD